jgi:hypothetical protein
MVDCLQMMHIHKPPKKYGMLCIIIRPCLIQGFDMQKIFCFGDGFATGHIWPEWPQILQALLPDHQVVNTAGIGAGTEFLVSGFVDMLPDIANSTVIFQWPFANRFDKLLQDDSWQHTITSDPAYHFNVVADTKHRNWWLSSASQTPQIADYQRIYIQSQQHALRQHVYKELVSHTADALNCKIIHSTTMEQDQFSRSTRFTSTRSREVQPSPVVHFYWIIEHIVPQMNVTVDPTLQNRLELLINQTVWTAYDPDREEIWADLLKKLKTATDDH